MDDTQRLGGRRQASEERRRTPTRRHIARLTATIAAARVTMPIAATFVVYNAPHSAQAKHSAPHCYGLRTNHGSYIGLYPHGVPPSYTPPKAFTIATEVKPNVAVYYSRWLEPFQVRFAAIVACDGAVPLVQMNPTRTSVAAIAAGQYGYLTTYAEAVRAYRHPVILSFGHERNGNWYSCGYTHTSPVVSVAAWRHIVTLSRSLRVQNVTWLWTINTIHKHVRIPSPGPYWSENSYVTWVEIDGYFTESSSMFASVFGPTIVHVRSVTHGPILIAETSATPLLASQRRFPIFSQGFTCTACSGLYGSTPSI